MYIDIVVKREKHKPLFVVLIAAVFALPENIKWEVLANKVI